MGNLYEYSLIENSILHCTLLIASITSDIAHSLFKTYSNDKSLPDFSDFILDASQVTDIDKGSLGVLMKSLGIMKKAKGYLVLVMNEEFLQKMMMEQPEMFNYFAIFHTIDDAVMFIKKSRI